jgi:hypothetical protein
MLLRIGKSPLCCFRVHGSKVSNGRLDCSLVNRSSRALSSHNRNPNRSRNCGLSNPSSRSLRIREPSSRANLASSIEKLFGGQKATPPQAQPEAAQQPSIKTEDLPKPR